MLAVCHHERLLSTVADAPGQARPAGPARPEVRPVTDCLFCRIARGELDAQVVYRDEQVVAFRDVNPQGPVHILVIPVEHLPGIADAGDEHNELLGRMLNVARRIAADEGVAQRGYRLVINQGRDVGQSVDHLHLHLIGGRPMGWPPG